MALQETAQEIQCNRQTLGHIATTTVNEPCLICCRKEVDFAGQTNFMCTLKTMAPKAKVKFKSNYFQSHSTLVTVTKVRHLEKKRNTESFL